MHCADNIKQKVILVEPEGLPQDKFKGPEFSLRSKNRSNVHTPRKLHHRMSQRNDTIPELLSSRIMCTACRKQVNPFYSNSLFEHPVLKVLLCKSCNDYYHSGEFVKDEDGIDNHCRWCGDGGKVTLCDGCSNVFCKACIRCHVSRTEYTRIQAHSWHCFVCDPTPIQDKVKECRQILKALTDYRNALSLTPTAKKVKRKPRTNISTQNNISTDEELLQNNHVVKIESPPSNQRNHNAPESSTPQRELRTHTKPDGVSKAKDALQIWKVDCLEAMNTMQQKLSGLHQEFKFHFNDKNENGTVKKVLLSRNYTKEKTAKEVKVQLQKLKVQCESFIQYIGSMRNELHSIKEEKYCDLTDVWSTSAKESDTDCTMLSTPSRKKLLRKRKDLDNSRLSSSNENESPRKPFPSKTLFNDNPPEKATSSHNELQKPLSNDDVAKPLWSDGLLSGALSDSGSSRMQEKYNRPVSAEVDMSAASLSDIFDSDFKEKKQSHDEQQHDSDVFAGTSGETEKDSKPVVKVPQLNVPGTCNPTLDEKAEKFSHGTTSEDDSTDTDVDIEFGKRQKTDKTDQSKSKDEGDENVKKPSAIVVKMEPSSSDDTFIESGSGQATPSKISDFLDDGMMNWSDDNVADSGIAAAANRIALSNLEKQRLSQESEDDDTDVEALLDRESKPGHKETKCQSEPEREIPSYEKDEGFDDKPAKKHPFRNPLLALRISLSDCEMERKKLGHTMRKRKLSAKSPEPSEKKIKKELCCDEALNDPHLSDEDIAVLNKTDEDLLLEDVKIPRSDSKTVDAKETEKRNDNENAATSDTTKQQNIDDSDDADEVPETQMDGVGCEKVKDETENIVKDETEISAKTEPEMVNLGSSSSGGDDVSENLDVENSDGDSDFPAFGPTSCSTRKLKGVKSLQEMLSSNDDFCDLPPSNLRKKKRRRKIESDSDGDCIEIKNNSSDSEDSQSLDESKSGRRHIRKIKEVSRDTRTAEKEERERRKRLENSQEDEVIIIEDDSSPLKHAVASRLILSKTPTIEVDPSIVCKLKEHQLDGVKFLWKNVIEDVKRANSSKGDGCILAHCMGLGKTLQAIAFLHTVLTSDHLPGLRTAMVICPFGTTLNWMSELRMWTRKCQKPIKLYEVERKTSENAKMLKQWQMKGGVAVIGYAKYRSLCLRRAKNLPKAYKDIYLSALQDPGPDIVICDEGHVLKNEKTDLSAVVEKIITSRRIVLTGTPLQNNLIEYHCMVSFIKPRLLGDRKEFSNRFVNPILNGQHVDSTKTDVRLMKQRSHVLHEMLAGCVQRKDVGCLRNHLQPKFEYVLLVRLSPLQVRLYEHYMEEFKCLDIQGRKGQIFQDFHTFLLINAHPRSLQLDKHRQELKEEQEEMRRFVVESDEEEEDSTDTSSSEQDKEGENGKKKVDISTLPDMSIAELKKVVRENGGDLSFCIDKQDLIERARKVLDPSKHKNDNEGKPAWYDSVMPAQDNLIHNIEHSGKILLLLEILRLATEAKDKVVVFSQSLLTLNLIEQVLADVSRRKSGEMDVFGSDEPTRWIKDFDYFRLDGSTQAMKRKMHVDRFNSKTNRRSRLFLISTKAGGIGINLIGANRAVLFDASWNPTHDVQSIFRIYRFGQDKPCYVYRLIGQGTMEEKIYERQVVKQSLAFRVVDEQQIERHFTANDIAELYRFKPKKLERKSQENSTPDQAVPKDKVMADLLLNTTTRDAIVSFHEHDSLLDHQVSEELTMEERQLAWDEYNRERHPPVKSDDPMLKLSTADIDRLAKAIEDELKENKEFLNRCQESPLHCTMLNLKAYKRDLNLEELQDGAVQFQMKVAELRSRLERTRRLLLYKLEQLRFCKTQKTSSASTSAIRPPPAGAQSFQPRPPPPIQPRPAFQRPTYPSSSASHPAWNGSSAARPNNSGSTFRPRPSNQHRRASASPNAANVHPQPRSYRPQQGFNAGHPRFNNFNNLNQNPFMFGAAPRNRGAYNFPNFQNYPPYNGRGPDRNFFSRYQGR